MFDIFKVLNKDDNTIQNKKTIEYIIAGLGNPGNKYEQTRHNVGFMAIENIEKECNATIQKSKFKALIRECEISEKRVLLVKPQTFMNNSGESLSEVMCFYKIPPEKTIIIFDDISLPPGKIRIRRKGSHGGHNGMKNITALTGSANFPRIKIGIGDKPPGWDLADWVLSKFNKEDMLKINDSIKNTFSALEYILNNRIDDAMNKFN